MANKPIVDPNYKYVKEDYEYTMDDYKYCDDKYVYTKNVRGSTTTPTALTEPQADVKSKK